MDPATRRQRLRAALSDTPENRARRQHYDKIMAEIAAVKGRLPEIVAEHLAASRRHAAMAERHRQAAEEAHRRALEIALAHNQPPEPKK